MIDYHHNLMVVLIEWERLRLMNQLCSRQSRHLWYLPSFAEVCSFVLISASFFFAEQPTTIASHELQAVSSCQTFVDRDLLPPSIDELLFVSPSDVFILEPSSVSPFLCCS